jgi:5-(carboxyamino)imidazole ribonucleotide mutase
VVSAHRTPDWMFEYASTAESRGLEVIIAAAGGAAHLPGDGRREDRAAGAGRARGGDAARGRRRAAQSIVQMPKGVPVGTLAIGKPGAANAALLAARILATSRPALRERLRRGASAHREVMQADGAGMTVILPGATIGILGGGQLGRMTAMAARSLGYTSTCSTPTRRCAARFVVERCLTAAFDDDFAAADLARHCAVVTLEIEKIAPPPSTRPDATRRCARGATVLAVVQDRGRQKQWLSDHGFPWGPGAGARASRSSPRPSRSSGPSAS